MIIEHRFDEVALFNLPCQLNNEFTSAITENAEARYYLNISLYVLKLIECSRLLGIVSDTLYLPNTMHPTTNTLLVGKGCREKERTSPKESIDRRISTKEANWAGRGYEAR